MAPTAALALRELAAVVGGDLDGIDDPDDVIELGPRRVVVHSDAVEPGGVFVALAGRRDGHDWAAAAIESKAACAVVRRDWDAPGRLPLVRVDDTVEALGAMARWYRSQLTCEVVAVAGSLGKTTTKDALCTILSDSVFAYASPGSFNSRIGVPLSILGCPLDADVAVLEVAATEPGDMARQVELVRPSTVVITTVGDRFRRAFGDTGAYADELCDLARDAGTVRRVVCGDPSADLSARLPAGVDLVGAADASWPVEAVVRTSPRSIDVAVRAGGPVPERLTVGSSSSWVAQDVATAAATAVVMGRPVRSQAFAPTLVDLQTWRSPAGVLLVRSAAVDEPTAWRTALADGAAAVSGAGRLFVVLTDACDAVSPDTLSTIAHASAATVFAVAGRAATIVAGLDGVPPVRVFASPDDVRTALTAELVAGDVVTLLTRRGELLEGISRDLLEAMSPITLRIDLGAIELNVAALRAHVPGARLMAVVKAGAYGADAPELARHLAAFGVDQFAVSHTDEGVGLRRSGVAHPVLVLLATPDELPKAARHQLAVCLHSPELVAAALDDPSLVTQAHLEVDTGMHRTGLDPDAAPDALEALFDAGVPVVGLMTHLASAGDPALDDFTRSQLARFDGVVEAVRERGLPVPPRHALASAGVIRFPEHAMEMVRVGIALLGIAPSRESTDVPLVPALTLTSRLVARRDLRPGDAVGYGNDYVADRAHPIGTVQLGYNDGVFRSFAGRGAVMVNGRRCPVVGRISMDSLTIDLTDCPDAVVGSEVLVFGTAGESSQSIDDVADAMGSISYEVISRLGPRVQRVFVKH